MNCGFISLLNLYIFVTQNFKRFWSTKTSLFRGEIHIHIAMENIILMLYSQPTPPPTTENVKCSIQRSYQKVISDQRYINNVLLLDIKRYTPPAWKMKHLTLNIMIQSQLSINLKIIREIQQRNREKTSLDRWKLMTLNNVMDVKRCIGILYC